MNRILRPLGLALAFSLVAANADAQVPDHLQCLKIKDELAKTSYTATITPDDVTFPAATGCTIKVPAKLLCVDAVKSAVSPAPPGADDGAPAQKYLCYKTKCPKSAPTATLTDQFGIHTITAKSTGLVCAPVPVAAAPTCSDGIDNGNETDIDCGGGTCPDCDPGEECLVFGDCTSGVCLGGLCQTPSCSDLVENGNETGTDCGGGGCPQCPDGQGCNVASDCLSNACQGGVCVSLLSNGSVCSLASQCTSNSCVDGVCCNTSCSGLCDACTAAKKGSGMNGACGPIAVGSDPDGECATNTQASCGTNGFCSGSSSCSLYSAGTVCATGTCSMGVAQLADQCDGMGTCQNGGAVMCGNYICGMTSCLTNCSSDLQCSSGFYCSASSCVPKLSDGSLCGANGNCINGNCVDGVCCNSACGLTCEACTAAKKGSGVNGQCGFIANGTDPDSECVGTCDGAGMCQP